MTLKRLDAIATGVLATTAGSVLLVGLSGIFWEQIDQAMRQKETLGTVVGQEFTKVCRRTERGNPMKCLRLEKEKCPIIQYQPDTGPPLKLKDCSQPLSNDMQVHVMYDSKAPSDARSSLDPSLPFRWLPVFSATMPMAVGVLLLTMGIFKLWEGIKQS